MWTQEDPLNFGTDFGEFAPACTLDGQDSFALHKVFNDVALPGVKASGYVKAFCK